MTEADTQLSRKRKLESTSLTSSTEDQERSNLSQTANIKKNAWNIEYSAHPGELAIKLEFKVKTEEHQVIDLKKTRSMENNVVIYGKEEKTIQRP